MDSGRGNLYSELVFVMPLLKWAALNGATIESSLVDGVMVHVVKCVGQQRTFYIHDEEPFHWDLFMERYGDALQEMRLVQENPDRSHRTAMLGFKTCSNPYCEQCYGNNPTA